MGPSLSHVIRGRKPNQKVFSAGVTTVPAPMRARSRSQPSVAIPWAGFGSSVTLTRRRCFLEGFPRRLSLKEKHRRGAAFLGHSLSLSRVLGSLLKNGLHRTVSRSPSVPHLGMESNAGIDHGHRALALLRRVLLETDKPVSGHPPRRGQMNGELVNLASRPRGWQAPRRNASSGRNHNAKPYRCLTTVWPSKLDQFPLHTVPMHKT